MIFLDASSTTKPYNEVIDVMSEIQRNYWYNPSASYGAAYDTMMLIENVRKQVAKDINCKPTEIIFTASGCESNSLAISGFIKKHNALFITSKLEHTSIKYITEHNENFYDFVDNDGVGTISQSSLETLLSKKYITNKEILVSISFANSEIGVIEDIKSIAEIVHKYGGVLHVDATQYMPWYRVDVQNLGIDMMSFSAQKFHGPRGAGVLFIKGGIEIDPIIFGSQENYLRGSTYNTAAIVGMGKALEIIRRINVFDRVKYMRDKIIDCLSHIEGVAINGPIGDNRLPNNISVTINGVSADHLVTICDMMGILIAKGSACQSYNPVPSKTLIAIGLTKEQALSTVRITLDDFNTWKEIDEFCKVFPKIINEIRKSS